MTRYPSGTGTGVNMKQIHARMVELTPAEMLASKRFEALLDEGYGIHAAVDQVETERPNLDPEFYLWLRS